MENKKETVVTPQKRDINILSNILLTDNILYKVGVTENGDIASKENAVSQTKAAKSPKLDESPVIFKNLVFDLPVPKRKNGFADREITKKQRTECNDGSVGDINEGKIFNYLTGTYESIKENIKEEFLEESLEIKEEPLLFHEEEFETASDNNSGNVGISVTSNDTIIKDHLTKPLKFEVFNNTILNKFVNNEGQMHGDIILLGTTLNVVNGVKCKAAQPLNHNVDGSNNVNNLGSSLFKLHLTNELNLTQYKCQSCLYIANTKTELMSHIENVHFECGEKRLEASESLNQSTKATVESSNKNTPSQFGCLQNKTLIVLLRRENFDHIHNSRDSTVDVKCFDCDTVFDERSELEVHASLIHSISAFKCDLHLSEKLIKTCSKCVYESVLNSCRKSTSNVHIELSEQEKVCSIVERSEQTLNLTAEAFKIKETIVILSDDETVEEINPVTKNGDTSQGETKQEYIVVVSDDEIVGDTNKQLEFNNVAEEIKIETSCGSGNDKSELGGGHDAIVNMAGPDEHNQTAPEVICGEEKCDKMDSGANDVNEENNCFENGYSDVDDSGDNNDQVETTNISETNILKFQCFDCPYSNVGDLPQFKLHVAKHKGSKFRCMPHPDTNDKNCAKCCYENTLNDVKNHNLNDENLCDVQCSPGDVKCFHCPYVTSRKKYLYYHAVDHVQESFTCTNHSSARSLDACLECIYEYCLKMAKKDVLNCEICDFKTVSIAVFDVHQCNNSCSAPYTCWDCHLDSFKTINELREHSIAHYKSEFRCKDHEGAVNNCSQCLYEALANSLGGNKSCSDQHCAGDCSTSVASNRNDFKCFHCNYKTSNKNLLKFHCKEHYGKSFICETHAESPQVGCAECIYQKLLNGIQKSLFVCTKCDFKTFNSFLFKSHTSKSHAVPYSTLPHKCFDCTATFKVFQGLKYHAICHIDISKFKCTDHKSNQVTTCPKCIYENLINTLKEGTFSCKKCGYKTCMWNHMRSHESDETHCEAYKAKLVAQGKSVTVTPDETYSCFDCDFSHQRLDFLKAHVKEHRGSKFQCNEQHETPNADCPKCRYVQLVAARVKELLCCYDCDKPKRFRDLLNLHKHVAEKHSRSNFACIAHIEKKDNDCGKCMYQEIVREVVGDHYVSLVCWDCDGKLFSHMATYEDHIVQSHLNSSFLCLEHCGHNYKRCSKCLYQRMLQRHSIITPTSKIVTFQCFQCNYSNKQLHIFIRHIHSTHQHSTFECDQHSLNSIIPEYCPQCFYYRIKTDRSGASPFVRCYECNLANKWSFYRLRFLKDHVKEKHKKCAFVCTLHPNNGGVNCEKCWFEVLVREVTKKREQRYQCFGCSFESDNLDLFKSHVHQTHKHTMFKCKDHLNEALIDCPQCFYASIFSEACKFEANTTNNEVTCYACINSTPLPSANTLRKHILDRHRNSAFICPSHTVKMVNCGKCLFQRSLETIQEQLQTSLRCFDCDYTMSKFSGLRYHVWQRHRDSEYRCTEHVAKTVDCQKCSYTTMIENLRNFTCYGCETLPVFSGYDTLKRHVYKAHEKNFYVCPDEHGSRSGCGKCFFQKVVRDAFILQCHDCDVEKAFQDKDCLKQHIKSHHISSKFICKLHPLGPKWDTCSQCCYEKLLRVSLTDEESRQNTSNNANFATFKCFDCNYETDRDVIIKWHIQNRHFDSEFTCRTHVLGEINLFCPECTYENLVLQVKEQSA